MRPEGQNEEGRKAMPPATSKQDELRQALATHKLLVDTCFLMDQNLPVFLRDFTAVFQLNKILVPKRVKQELQRIVKLNDHRLSAATRALQSVEAAVRDGLAELRGEASDETTKVADHVIVRVVLQHIAQHNILVLTQDRSLMRDIFQIKNSESFAASRSLLVVRFTLQTGRPHLVRSQPRRDPTANPGPSHRPVPSSQPRQRPMNRPAIPSPFRKSTTLAPDLEVRLQPQEDVEKSGIVYLNGRRPVRLTSRLASGGEGTVFETDQAPLFARSTTETS